MLTRRQILRSASIATLATACSDRGPARILYVNSYHEGYGSSDDVMAGLHSILDPAGVYLRKFYLDAKRQSAEDSVRAKAEEALAAVREFDPAVLIVSDDAAAQHLVVPHFKEGPLPVVFCGINWSCEQYGLPTASVTGMLEVLPVEDTIAAVRESFPGLKRLAHLSENSISERSNQRLMDDVYNGLGLEATYTLADDFEAWKDGFRTANAEADILFLPTNGAITGWDDAEARAWIEAHISKPVVTCDDFMMPFVVFGLTKVASEQGEWAARTALEILAGASPADIPVARNSQTKAWLNTGLAGKIGFAPSTKLLERCEKVG